MTGNDDTAMADAILDMAMAIAEETSWEQVRLHQVAQRLHIGLDTIARHYPEKDCMIDAWFDRADRAVLAQAGDDRLAMLAPRERLETLIMAWLGALEGHRKVTRQMILAKLEPGHLHIQLPALTRISRSVQWMREAAGLRDSGLMRAITESGCTAIYLGTFTRWMFDNQSGSPRTRHYLQRALSSAECCLRLSPLPWPVGSGDSWHRTSWASR